MDSYEVCVNASNNNCDEIATAPSLAPTVTTGSPTIVMSTSHPTSASDLSPPTKPTPSSSGNTYLQVKQYRESHPPYDCTTYFSLLLTKALLRTSVFLYVGASADEFCSYRCTIMACGMSYVQLSP